MTDTDTAGACTLAVHYFPPRVQGQPYRCYCRSVDEASIVDVAEIVKLPPILTCGICGQPSEGRSHGHSIDDFREALRRDATGRLARVANPDDLDALAARIDAYRGAGGGRHLDGPCAACRHGQHANCAGPNVYWGDCPCNCEEGRSDGR